MLLYPWGSPGKNTGVGCQALLQGIFPTCLYTCAIALSKKNVHTLILKYFLAKVFCPGGKIISGRHSSSLMSPALASGFFTTSDTWEALQYVYILLKFVYMSLPLGSTRYKKFQRNSFINVYFICEYIF